MNVFERPFELMAGKYIFIPARFLSSSLLYHVTFQRS